ncbi:MAG: FlgD immunoglobulin-like domain containing protein [Candidatus Cloacimonadaceae bacterium]
MHTNYIRLLIILGLLLWASLSFSSVTDYTFSSSLGNYNQLTGGTVHGTSANDNEVFNAIPIGFDFTFNSVLYTEISIAANGFIAMGAAATSSNTAISTGVSNNVIVPLNRDIKSRDDGSLTTHLTGTAPNRILTVQWFNYKRIPTAAANDTLNFQINLHETSNLITFNYGYFFAASVTTAATVQCGLRGADNTDFFNRTTTTDWTATATGTVNTASCRMNDTIIPPQGLIFTWTPPQAGTPPNPAEIVSPANGASNVALNANLVWLTGGGATTGYKVFLGTDNPPTNIVNGTLQTDTTYDPVNDFTYSTVYYWKIVPTNDFGDAVDCPVWSFTAMPDPLVTVFPYTQNWDTVTAPAVPPSWTIVNVNSDNFTWVTVSSGAFSAPNALRCSFNSSSAIPMNDWAISPPLQLTGDTNYRILFQYKAQNASSPEKLEVKFGTANNPAALTTQIFVNENITNTAYVLGQAFITPSTNGIYYVGWHGYSNANMYYLFIDNITIEEFVPVFNPPQNLAALGGIDLVSLSWELPVESTPAGYNVYRDDVLITPTQVTALTFEDNTAQVGTTYSYHVTALYTDPVGESDPSNIVQAEPLNPPTELSAQVTGDDVNLSWTSPFVPAAMNLRDLTGFKVFRDGTLITTITDPDTETYTDENLTPGTYAYTVSATYTTGESVAAGPVQAVIIIIFYPPSNLIASPTLTSIILNWDAPSPLLPNFSGYRLYKDGSAVSHNLLTTNMYIDTNIINQVSYTYYVVAVYTDPTGVSDPSNTVTAAAGEALNPVTNLQHTVSQDSVFLSWNAPGRPLTGYKVYRDGAPLYTITDPGVTTCIDSGLPNGTFIYYVTALYTLGESAPCDPVFATVDVTANPPEVIPVTATTLLGNYPNPFKQQTKITYHVKDEAPVLLEIYDLKGRKVRTLTSGRAKAGSHTIDWKGTDQSGKAVAGGVYFLRMTSGSYTSARKLMLLR